MAPALHVKIDDSQLNRWAAELSRDALRKAIRNAVDKAGRETFKETADLIEQETGVPRSKWGSTIGRMRRPTQNDLSARVTYSRKKVSILNVKGASVVPGKGLTVVGWALSARGVLKIGRAFVAGAKSQKGASKGKATGKGYVLMRVDKGRYPLRAINAATPAAVMGNGRGIVVKRFRTVADAKLQKHLNADVQKALNGQSTSA
jgi:hypothetical protein